MICDFAMTAIPQPHDPDAPLVLVRSRLATVAPKASPGGLTRPPGRRVSRARIGIRNALRAPNPKVSSLRGLWVASEYLGGVPLKWVGARYSACLRRVA